MLLTWVWSRVKLPQTAIITYCSLAISYGSEKINSVFNLKLVILSALLERRTGLFMAQSIIVLVSHSGRITVSISFLTTQNKPRAIIIHISCLPWRDIIPYLFFLLCFTYFKPELWSFFKGIVPRNQHTELCWIKWSFSKARSSCSLCTSPSGNICSYL